MTSYDPAESVILRALRTALHAGFLLLLGIATTRLFATRDAGALSLLALAGAVVLAAVYLLGALARHGGGRLRSLVWLAVVTALWAALLVTSADFSWVAFPLFFLHLHLLRGVHAVAAVAAITGLVIGAQFLHSGELTVPMALGPTLGAVVAVVMAWGYASIHSESEQRRRLIEDLTRTRAELASSQHRAGVAAERERLAREIHDTLAQGLSSVVLLLRSAEAALPGDHERALDRVSEARRTASDNLTEARRFVRDLTPQSLTGSSLAEALRRLCESTERETGIHCRLRVDGEPDALPSGYEVALLRAAQASLANVTRHSGAVTAVVTLGFLDAEVTLDVYDDGSGFDPAALRRSGSDGTGYGLPALRERVAAFGGSLEVESAPGEGAAVAIRLPLGGEDER